MLDELDATAGSSSSTSEVRGANASSSKVQAGFSGSGCGSGHSGTMLSESLMTMGMNTDFKCNIGSELFLSSCSAAVMMRNRRDGKNAPKCELDSQGCLSLGNILESFSAAINEEHAWAICFQFAITGRSVLADPECRKECHIVSKTDHVKLHSEGYVHDMTFLPHLSNNRPGKGLFILFYFMNLIYIDTIIHAN